MVKATSESESQLISDAAISGIQEKMGERIIKMDMTGIEASVCDYFVICHGNSKKQVEAIADSVEGEIRKTHHAKPWHKEGFQNAEWILLDYVDVVIHVFRKEVRDFYQLEELWGDAVIREVPSTK